MEVLVRIVLGVRLVAHGLVHLLWLAQSDDPAWPFRLDRSWLVSEATRKHVAVVLIALIVAGFALLGLAVGESLACLRSGRSWLLGPPSRHSPPWCCLRSSAPMGRSN